MTSEQALAELGIEILNERGELRDKDAIVMSVIYALPLLTHERQFAVMDALLPDVQPPPLRLPSITFSEEV